ncbi:MAG TPA: hypothetical protein P5538_08075 [Bacteroidales bacterium]|nr:hypothetical protein [Bacteroidales bacterium]HOL98647.1 hypothetical protein [Bacteroidales bacterium]HOM35894.1 hypothetical protein [Bacteroidales bacterium]HPD24466.1 hypothetical protein [Bacteroidales bacterium]HRT00324.1 hypothetical protein [Bacteroidales bacterium]
MKTYIYAILGLTIVSGLTFSSCDPNKPNNEGVIEVTSDITEPTTWSGDKIYVIKKFDFIVEAELTIEPGAIIKLHPNYKTITIAQGGKILARGTASSPIVFTSFKDDTSGGDTNGDGGITTPAVGDWQSIDINGTSGSEFIYCKFLYGGFGLNPSPTLDLSTGGSSAKIENCTFANNGGGKNGSFYVGVLHADNAANSTIIRNNTFYNNVLPLTINAEIDIDNSNTFSYQSFTNTYNSIFVFGNIDKNTSWGETEVAFVITSENMQVGVGKTLTLANSVVLKFLENGQLTLLSGESSLINYNGSGVFYTSFKDDDLKGDSNGDGTSSVPATADWTGIYLDNWDKTVGWAQWENIRYNNPNATVK